MSAPTEQQTPVEVHAVTATETPKAEIAEAERTRKPRRRPQKPKTAVDGTAAPEQQEEDNTHKVFVGNLAFATTEEELKTFGSPAGEVVKVEIILRGTRSLGYGFVSYNTEEEANKAVTLLDKKELGGRQVNVESAKLRQANAQRPRTAGRGRRGRGGRGYMGRGRARSAGTATAEKRVDDETPAEGESADAPATTESARGRRGRGGRRFPRGSRTPRAQNGERPEVTGELSETGLFVANLPFKVTDDDLKSIFKDYKVTKSRVVRLRSGRSKGFGFVEVESKEEQSRIVNELKNVVVEGRELVIKVALANQTAPDAETGEEAAPVATA